MLALVVATALGCEGQQYVSADTVALSIDDAKGTTRLDACHYIPVLLGSRSVSHYTVDGSLEVTLDITRDEVTVVFDSLEQAVEPFRVPSARFEEAAHEEDPAPPSGYTVELTSPCAP
jgi:hypothetical protein